MLASNFLTQSWNQSVGVTSPNYHSSNTPLWMYPMIKSWWGDSVKVKHQHWDTGSLRRLPMLPVVIWLEVGDHDYHCRIHDHACPVSKTFVLAIAPAVLDELRSLRGHLWRRPTLPNPRSGSEPVEGGNFFPYICNKEWLMINNGWRMLMTN